jgi:lipopolysaccharide transport system ATP-binding protein
LTGRENIYLNGSILGLKRSEINAKFDEIIDFSGIEKFLNTPLKHYSSGMKLRLAFSVAAHLEPEILLIDEVLAVGDAEFQKKCLGKMDEVSKSGRTVLFVSHNLGVVRQLCNRGILLNNGQIRQDATIEESLEQYYQSTFESSEIDLNNVPRSGKGDLRIKRIYFTNFKGEVLQTQLVSGSDIILNIAYQANQSIHLKSIDFGISIYDQENRFITVLNNTMSNFHFKEIPSNGTMRCKLEKLPLTFGSFNTSFSLNANGILMDRIENAFSFSVLEGDYYNSNFSNCHSRTGVYIKQSWEIDT